MTTTGYSRFQISLHWLTAGLLAVSFFSHESMKESWRAIRRGLEVEALDGGTQVHVLAGIAVLLLTLLRLVLRWTHGAPAEPEGASRPLSLIARLTHWLLYALLLAVPAAGAAAWFLGYRDAGEMHETLFTALWLLVALHTAAALFHQYWLRDNLLVRMLRPG